MLLEDKNNTPELYAELYSKYKIVGTPYLPFRDLPQIIKKYVVGRKTIDYGCGSGESTVFLKTLGLDVIGMDINEQMVHKSKILDPYGEYIKIDSGKIPKEDKTYDLVFASFVLLEISTKEENQNVINDISRVLKPGGVFITIVANENTYKHNWLTINTNFETNRNITSGSKVQLRFKDIDLEIFDYYWTEEDYVTMFVSAGLEVLKIHKPIGLDSDGYSWLDEKIASPSSVFVAQKL